MKTTDGKETIKKENFIMRHKGSAVFFLLAVIILLQMALIIYTFAEKKEGQHSDEIWAYGLANSTDGPHIFMDADTEEDKYLDEWISGDVFKDYIVVGKDERFSYGNVISNLKKDTAPPLFCLILHTICSFFPETYSRWYAFSINIVAFLITQILFFILVKKLTNGNFWAFMAVILYGFSQGALNTVIFARHYMLLTMFTVMTMLFHLMFLRAEDKKAKIKACVGIAVSVFGGMLSHYFFLVFLAGFAVLYTAYFVLKKQLQKACAYIPTVLFPTVISALFSNVGAVLNAATVVGKGVARIESGVFSGIAGMVGSVFGIIYDPQFEKCANMVLWCLLNDLFGIDVHPDFPYWLYHLLFIFLFICIIFVLISVVTKRRISERKNSSSADTDLETLEKSRVLRLLEKPYDMLAGIGEKSFFMLALLFAAAAEIYIVIGKADPLLMLDTTDRYIFMIYPSVYLLLLMLIRRIAKNRRLLTSTLIGFILIANNVGAHPVYLFTRPAGQERIEDLAPGNDVVIVLSKHWLMTCYASYLAEAQNVLVTDYWGYYEDEDKFRQIDTKDAYVIFDVDQLKVTMTYKYDCKYNEVTRDMLEKEYLDYLADYLPDRSIEYVSEDEIFGRQIFIYRVSE